jgi:hypothetical protein
MKLFLLIAHPAMAFCFLVAAVMVIANYQRIDKYLHKAQYLNNRDYSDRIKENSEAHLRWFLAYCGCVAFFLIVFFMEIL